MAVREVFGPNSNQRGLRKLLRIINKKFFGGCRGAIFQKSPLPAGGNCNMLK